MLHNSTVLTATDVRRIIKQAKESGLNQHLSELEVQRLNLNPDGLSILSIAIPYHDYRHGPDHHRVNAFLAVRGQDAPAEIPMDVLAEDWDGLPQATGPEGRLFEPGFRCAVISEESLRALIRRWISKMNHPQLSQDPQARYAYEKCIIDVQDLIKETQNV